MNKLPLAVAWIRGSRDAVRDEMPAMLREDLGNYAEQAREQCERQLLELLGRKALVRSTSNKRTVILPA